MSAEKFTQWDFLLDEKQKNARWLQQREQAQYDIRRFMHEVYQDFQKILQWFITDELFAQLPPWPADQPFPQTRADWDRLALQPLLQAMHRQWPSSLIPDAMMGRIGALNQSLEAWHQHAQQRLRQVHDRLSFLQQHLGDIMGNMAAFQQDELHVRQTKMFWSETLTIMKKTTYRVNLYNLWRPSHMTRSMTPPIPAINHHIFDPHYPAAS